MKTKYGEIEKTEDLFEINQIRNSQWYVKCKICGQVVSKNLIWFGAFDQMEKHLELHKINGLDV